MNINRNLTTVNFTKGYRKKNRFIVIHYTAGSGDAKNQTTYFKQAYRGASAHYFVGFAGDVWQSVDDANIAWHVGANSYKHPTCRNSNSIGIELCVRKRSWKSVQATDTDWYFEDATVKAAVELTKELMKKYDIPVQNVIRHYDVTGKICPAPYVHDETLWKKFLGMLTEVPVDVAQSKDQAVAGQYECKAAAYLRSGASKHKEVLATIPAKTVLRNYGYYTVNQAGNMWLFFQYDDQKGYVYIGNLTKVGG